MVAPKEDTYHTMLSGAIANYPTVEKGEFIVLLCVVVGGGGSPSEEDLIFLFQGAFD